MLSQARKPLLVSHAYKGDRSHQDDIAKYLKGQFARFAVNAHPVSTNGETDTTMRTRSCNFLAFDAIAASAVQAVSQKEKVELYVPENGFISLNAPLTTRRIGSLSTRTTHPYFLDSIQGIFDKVEIPCMIKNLYQFKTKGEMVTECKDAQLLKLIVDNTVSCSHWKRKHQQCGTCVPCLIRRAALHAGGLSEQTEYLSNNVANVLGEPGKRDDLMALSIAIEQKSKRKLGPWILDSGPLPPEYYQDFQEVFLRGLDEVKGYLKAVRVL